MRELETIDIEHHEYEFCDEYGQPYVGEASRPPGIWRQGAFDIVPRGSPDPVMPASFIARTKHFSAESTAFKTLEDVRIHLLRPKT